MKAPLSRDRALLLDLSGIAAGLVGAGAVMLLTALGDPLAAVAMIAAGLAAIAAILVNWRLS